MHPYYLLLTSTVVVQSHIIY